MSEYLRHLVTCTNRIEEACRRIRECASQLAVENSNSAEPKPVSVSEGLFCGEHNKQSDAITLWKQYVVAAQNGMVFEWLYQNDELIRAVIA